MEVADPDVASEVLMKLFLAEDAADYRGYEDGDFRLVHSSILKAVLRSCSLYGICLRWRSLLELFFDSEAYP